MANIALGNYGFGGKWEIWEMKNEAPENPVQAGQAGSPTYQV